MASSTQMNANHHPPATNGRVTSPSAAAVASSSKNNPVALSSSYSARAHVNARPPWVSRSSVDESYEHTPPQHPDYYVRRLSRDGYEDWVDPRWMNKSMWPEFMRKREDKPARRWDHLRTNDPPIMGLGYRPPNVDPWAKWRKFLQDSPYPDPPLGKSWVVQPEDLESRMPLQQRHASMGSIDPLHLPFTTPPKPLSMRVNDFILRHPLPPLIFRLLVLTTSITALVISVNIFKTVNSPVPDTTDNSGLNQSPTVATYLRKQQLTQSVFNIVIDALAIPYIMYMAWDEFVGSPLGLRSPMQKISLTLLDLVFIVLKAASTALAFQALEYHENASSLGTFKLARALAGLMLTGLLCWLVNFTISIFRLAERLGAVGSSEK